MKFKFFQLCLLVFFVVILYSCSSSKQSGSSVELQTGDYTYTVFDSGNKSVLEGRLTVDNLVGTVVSGNYKTTKVNDSTFSLTGMLSGGNFSGKFNPSSGTIALNMNPKVADNNVYFSGKVSGDNITGDWSQSTMTGTKNTGKFQAVKQ